MARKKLLPTSLTAQSKIRFRFDKFDWLAAVFVISTAIYMGYSLIWDK